MVNAEVYTVEVEQFIEGHHFLIFFSCTNGLGKSGSSTHRLLLRDLHAQQSWLCHLNDVQLVPKWGPKWDNKISPQLLILGRMDP